MTKQHLLLLHGALGASSQLASLALLLQERYDVHMLNFEGHGTAPLQSRPFRIEHFVENVLHYLRQQDLVSVNIFGYSMGGFVACSLAMAHPETVQSIVTLGTKFYWNREVATREVAYLDIEKMKAKVPNFVQALVERHTSTGWETVVTKTAEMMLWLGANGGLTPDDVAPIRQRVRVMVGDRDTTVSVTEAYEMYKAISPGEMEVLPQTPHQMEKVPLTRLTNSLIEFFG